MTHIFDDTSEMRNLNIYCGFVNVTKTNYSTIYKFSLEYKINWMKREVLDFLSDHDVNSFYLLTTSQSMLRRFGDTNLIQILLNRIDNSKDILCVCDELFDDTNDLTLINKEIVLRLCKYGKKQDHIVVNLLSRVLKWMESNVNVIDGVIIDIMKLIDLRLVFAASSVVYNHFLHIVVSNCNRETIIPFVMGQHNAMVSSFFDETVNDWTQIFAKWCH